MSAVNDRLHILRGEHYRRELNRRPPPPSATPPLHDNGATPAQRAHVLSLVLPLPPARVPSLTRLCLRILASVPAHQFTHDVLPWLPAHLRRDLVRESAVHGPLDDAKLWPLYAPHGHAAAELLVVAPHALLPDDYFTHQPPSSVDWETDLDSAGAEAEPLATLALVSARLAPSTLLSFPPSITRMALLDLPAPVPLHRLPGTCPRLVVLDLSYNSWLCLPDDADRALDRVEWSRWRDLSTLGLRACAVSSTILAKLNRGRWDDVEVVQ